MWTDSARAQYRRLAERYATDLTDAEFALIAPRLPRPSRTGRPRTVDLRAVLDSIFYLLRTGCQWALLPKEFPPKSTVYDYFRRWWTDGTLLTIYHALLELARVAAGREPQPTAGIVDSQSVKTAEAGGPRGFDAGKKINGRKRHLLELTIVKRSDHAHGFVVLPRRWVVERTFAWLGRNRRLAKDVERRIETSTAHLYLAAIGLITRRLARQ